MGRCIALFAVALCANAGTAHASTYLQRARCSRTDQQGIYSEPGAYTGTFTNATTFSFAGNADGGPYLNGTAGVAYQSHVLEFAVSSGTTAWQAGDTFTVTLSDSAAPVVSYGVSNHGNGTLAGVQYHCPYRPLIIFHEITPSTPVPPTAMLNALADPRAGGMMLPIVWSVVDNAEPANRNDYSTYGIYSSPILTLAAANLDVTGAHHHGHPQRLKIGITAGTFGSCTAGTSGTPSRLAHAPYGTSGKGIPFTGCTDDAGNAVAPIYNKGATCTEADEINPLDGWDDPSNTNPLTFKGAYLSELAALKYALQHTNVGSTAYTLWDATTAFKLAAFDGSDSAEMGIHGKGCSIGAVNQTDFQLGQIWAGMTGAAPATDGYANAKVVTQYQAIVAGVYAMLGSSPLFGPRIISQATTQSDEGHFPCVNESGAADATCPFVNICDRLLVPPALLYGQQYEPMWNEANLDYSGISWSPWVIDAAKAGSLASWQTNGTANTAPCLGGSESAPSTTSRYASGNGGDTQTANPYEFASILLAGDLLLPQGSASDFEIQYQDISQFTSAPAGCGPLWPLNWKPLDY